MGDACMHVWIVTLATSTLHKHYNVNEHRIHLRLKLISTFFTYLNRCVVMSFVNFRGMVDQCEGELTNRAKG